MMEGKPVGICFLKMLFKTFLIVIFIAVFHCESYDEVAEFDEFLKNEKSVLVLFTEECCACTECVEAEALLGAMSITFEDEFSLQLVRLKQPILRKKYGVKSTPTLVFIREGKPALYGGNLDQESIYFWVQDNKEPLAKELDDSSFEHLTQAATGATTGDWLVAFYKESCMKNNGFFAHLEGLGTLLKKTVNIATVDITKAPETVERFKIQRCPELILFRHGKMYRFNLPEMSLKTMKSFVEGFYKNSKVESVPLPITLFDKLIDKTVLYLRLYGTYIFGGLSAIIFVIIAVITIFFTGKEGKLEKKSN